MKTIYKALTCLLLVSFLAAGLAAVPRLKSVSAQDRDAIAELLTVVAKKVDEMPVIDGDFSDPAWAEATPTSIGGWTWKAVYDDDEVALYIGWTSHSARIDVRGTWNWDSETQTWWRTVWDTPMRLGEWFSISFDISSDLSTAPMTEEGCGAFCHEYPPGSGIFHHQTNALEAYVDSWLVFAKHGFRPNSGVDSGWLLGVTSASQEGDLVFNSSDPLRDREVIDGKVTFVGYSEDKVFASPDDPKFAARDTPADRYCQKCHDELNVIVEGTDPLLLNYTFGDPGDILYSENWNDNHAAPLYIEIAPEDWVDAMVITQAEIDSGEAVPVADLSADEITEYWDKYAALNAIVPNLVLQEPSGDQADIRTAATWHNGYWAVEMRRNRVTGSDYDVQFDDLNKDYPFAVTMNVHQTGFLYEGWTLRFEQ
ncbi:MAG: hypothetical protein KJ047_06770 [Anaerolineae bacterium]|nr:hypothetical protein [Anaerolineae bacterium]